MGYTKGADYRGPAFKSRRRVLQSFAIINSGVLIVSIIITIDCSLSSRLKQTAGSRSGFSRLSVWIRK
jgi:hypothetical protein